MTHTLYRTITRDGVQCSIQQSLALLDSAWYQHGNDLASTNTIGHRPDSNYSEDGCCSGIDFNLLIAISVINFADYFITNLCIIITPLLMYEYLPLSSIGLVLSARRFAEVFGVWLISMHFAVDPFILTTFGVVLLLIVVVLFGSGIMVHSGSPNSLGFFIAGYMLHGFSCAILSNYCRAIISMAHQSDHCRGRAINYSAMGSVIGAVLSPTLGCVMYTNALPWSPFCLIGSTLFCLLSYFLYLLIRKHECNLGKTLPVLDNFTRQFRSSQSISVAGIEIRMLETLLDPFVLLNCLLISISQSVIGILETLIVIYLGIISSDSSSLDKGLIYFSFVLFSIISLPLTSWCYEYRPKWNSYFIGFSFMGFGLISFGFGSSSSLTLFALMMIGSGIAFVNTCSFPLMISILQVNALNAQNFIIYFLGYYFRDFFQWKGKGDYAIAYRLHEYCTGLGVLLGNILGPLIMMGFGKCELILLNLIFKCELDADKSDF